MCGLQINLIPLRSILVNAGECVLQSGLQAGRQIALALRVSQCTEVLQHLLQFGLQGFQDKCSSVCAYPILHHTTPLTSESDLVRQHTVTPAR